MDFLKELWEDDTAVFYLFAGLMTIYQIYLWKKHKFYDFSKEMAQHILSKKYHLNRRANVDLERINRLLALANISAILCGCIGVTLFGFEAGLVTMGVLFVVFNWIATTYLGKYYSE